MTNSNKNEITQNLESAIRRATSKVGVFQCHEVTIGFGGTERVDFLTIDTKNIVRCYEVKSSVADFRSKAKWTFVGHYNYFVLTQEVFDKVKEEIPKHVGVYVYGTCVKNPKKQIVTDNTMTTIRMSMIRSLSRDVDKLFKMENPKLIERYESTIARLQKENYNLRYPRRN